MPQRDAAVITAAGGIITGALTISRINYLTAGRFPSGTTISLLFNTAGSSVQNSAYISLKSSFTTSAANTSLTLLSNGDGIWREVNRNN